MVPAASPTDPRRSYRIDDDPDQVAQEQARLLVLAELHDARTRAALTGLGIGPGWRCCDVGSGAGTIAGWMGEQVGPTGRVLSLDVDTRFQPPSHGPVEVRQVDLVEEGVPEGGFDLVHARALLQHLAQREQVLDALVAALAPGGWLVVQDSDWVQFEAQPLPEPFGSLLRASRRSSEQRHGHDPYFGRRLLPELAARGLVDLDAEGKVWTMHGGTTSAEWYVAGLARAAPGLQAAGVLPADLPVAAAIAQARRADFAILSPLSMLVRGRAPR
jgi:SAM-dependent methyltransferase